MPLYEFIFLIHPAVFFGCPEDGKLVFPAGGGDIFSGRLDIKTGNVIGHPTLSKYREASYDKTIEFSNTIFKFEDNFAFMYLEADDDGTVVISAISLINKFCLNLSVRNGNYFYYSIIQAKEGERRVLVPRNVNLFSARLYNLKGLSSNMDDASLTTMVSDSLLEKSSAYFCHALYMSEEIACRIEPFSFHGLLVISDIILNYNKATTTIVGDRMVDKDYETRYKRFGIDDSLWEDIQELRKLRNKYDIAHYSPDWYAIDYVKKHQSFAMKTTQSVILHYSAYLLKEK